MKRFILLAFTCIVAISTNAQHVGDALLEIIKPIKDVPEFKIALMAEGFHADTDSTLIGSGTYEHFSAWTLEGRVFDTFGLQVPPFGDYWGGVESTYKHFKSAFLKSMGTPIKVNESFDGKNQPDTDSEHMKELKSGKCNYSTIFASGSTTVLLDILYNEQFGPCIGITYMRNKYTHNYIPNEHLVFMQTPIDGSVEEFSQNLISKGLELTKTSKNFAELKGNFAGHSNTLISVFGNSRINKTSGVVVNFTHGNKWGEIMHAYENIKKLLYYKYGEPHTKSGIYSLDNPPASPTQELLGIMDGSKNYEISYSFNEGIISLTIGSNLVVMMAYSDRINGTASLRNAIDDI